MDRTAASPLSAPPIRLPDYFAITGCMLLWGLNIPVAKLGMAEIPPLLFMGLRFAIVAALLCPFVRFPKEKLGGILVLAVLLGGLNFSLMFTGVARMSAATASLLGQTSVPFAMIIAAILYGDRLGPQRILGIVISFIGVGLIAGEPDFGRDPVPLLLVLGASLAWALCNIQMRRIGPIDGFALTGWVAVFSFPQLLLLSAILEHGQLAALAGAGWRGWGSVAYSSLAVGLFSYQLWYPLIRRYPVNQIMAFNLTTPIVGVVGSALLLGEHLGWQTALGGAATLFGVAAIVLDRGARRRKEARA
jgi:O-acetylserine/cysteine efflux transporter